MKSQKTPVIKSRKAPYKKRIPTRTLAVGLERATQDFDMLLHAFTDRTDGLTDVTEMQGILTEMRATVDTLRTLTDQAFKL